MHSSAERMFADAGAVVLAVTPIVRIFRAVRGSDGVLTNAGRSVVLGASTGGAVGGAYGLLEAVLDDDAKQPDSLATDTAIGALVGAAVALVSSLTVDLVHRKVRRWRRW